MGTKLPGLAARTGKLEQSALPPANQGCWQKHGAGKRIRPRCAWQPPPGPQGRPSLRQL